MTALTLRGLFARKARAVLTGLAVLLGVAMISGTYVFTDTINSTFEKVFETANEGVDVVVSGRSEFDTENGPVTQEIPESLVDRVKDVPGVQTRGRQRRGLRLDLQGERRPGEDRRRAAAALLPAARAVRPARLRRGRAARQPPRRSRSTRGRPTTRT